MRRPQVAAAALGVLLAAGGCGSEGGPDAPTPMPTNPYRIVISAQGAVSPVELVVPPGTRVLFINNDVRRHDMSSDPHPDHTDCPEIDQLGVLQPGQMRETGNLVIARTCGFHDHDDPTNDRLRGRIVIR
jgi:hypothetical protein